MPTSFLDLLYAPDVQAAEQQARVTQQANSLSVTPRPALGGVVREASRAYAAGEDRQLEHRRLNLLKRADRFERRQAPFAIGLGALNLGTNLLAARQENRRFALEEARAARSEAIQQEQLDLLRKQAADRTAFYKDITGRYNRFLAPTPSYSIGK